MSAISSPEFTSNNWTISFTTTTVNRLFVIVDLLHVRDTMLLAGSAMQFMRILIENRKYETKEKNGNEWMRTTTLNDDDYSERRKTQKEKQLISSIHSITVVIVIIIIKCKMKSTQNASSSRLVPSNWFFK